MATNISGDTGIDKIQPGTIEVTDIPDSTITGTKLADATITAAKLANSINAEITANTAKVGITAGQASAITANTASLSDKADLAGANFTGNVDVTGTISLGGNWTIVETTGTLYFQNSGVSKVKITSDGAITSVGDVTAVGTM